MSSDEKDIRPSPIAGTWYTDDPQALQQEIQSYLAQAHVPENQAEVIGLIAPHAGYRYSGPTAGYAYRAVQGKQVDVVAVFSPFHAYTSERLLTTRHSAYQTPLGLVPVEKGMVNEFQMLIGKNNLTAYEIAFDSEHSLEIQLPFLQTALADKFQLFPLMVRTNEMEEIEIIAQAVAEVLKDKKVLLVASTDLSHYSNQVTACKLDEEMLKRIASFSPEMVLEAEEKGIASACGAGAVAAVMRTAQLLGAKTIRVLYHSTSGEETGDYSSVVGYGAAIIER
ncbi:MAG: AmmeMemoRadiSam system protein B [Anaerolineaceae bacterium]